MLHGSESNDDDGDIEKVVVAPLPPPLIRGGIIDEADTAEQVKREMTDRGIQRDNVQVIKVN